MKIYRLIYKRKNVTDEMGEHELEKSCGISAANGKENSIHKLKNYSNLQDFRKKNRMFFSKLIPTNTPISYICLIN